MSFETLSDSHTPISGTVFLDTSIHCSRFKGSLFQRRIESVLALFLWRGTSSYTKVEFGNVVLANAQYYLTLLDRFGSLEKALDWVGNVLSGRHESKRTWAFNLLTHHYGDNDAECTERARAKLRLLMRTGVALVEQLCDTPIANGTDCYWARKGVQRRPSDRRFVWRTPRCQRRRKQCRVDEFFTEKREAFGAIKDAIDSLPLDRLTAQLRAFSQVIGKALENPEILLQYREGCRRLADAIIAVESEPYGSMFTQNIAESEVLTEVFGQALYYLPPNQDRGVEVRLPVKSKRQADG